jgi:hypothetical protein
MEGQVNIPVPQKYVALHKMGMNNEPLRCQERQELSFSIKRENKIIPQICNAKYVIILKPGECEFTNLKSKSKVGIFCKHKILNKH